MEEMREPLVNPNFVGLDDYVEDETSDLDDDERNKIMNFKKDLSSEVSFHPPSKIGAMWVFWSGGSITDSATHTPTTNQPIITDYIKYALLHFDDNLRRDKFLIQFWAPMTTETGCVQLVTSDQPFALTYDLDERLLKYRKQCLQYKFNLDGDGAEEEGLGIPGRVFRQKWHECIPDVRHYSTKEYPQLDFALACHIFSCYSFPVFQTSFQECVGVVEIASTRDKDEFEVLYDLCNGLLRDEFKLAGLKTSFCDGYNCIRKVLNRFNPYVWNEIEEGLKAMCITHGLPFAKTWIPCGHFNGLDDSYDTFDVSCMGPAFHHKYETSYLLYNNQWEFFSHLNHFQKGHGVVGSAYQSHKLCFCRDITQFNITEYPSLPLARSSGLKGCFAICLQSTWTKNYDYILEFFLHPCNTYGEDLTTFLCPILKTMEEHFPSFKPAFGALQNGQEMMQPHSSNQQIILELDIDSQWNLVDAEQNNVPVTHSDDARMNQEPVSSQCQISPPGLEVSHNAQEMTQPHPPDQQQTDEFEFDVINGGRTVSTDQNNIPVSCSDEGRMNQEVATFRCQSISSPLGLGVLHDGQETSEPHSSIQQPTDEVEVDINNGRNVDAEQNITPGSSSNGEHPPFNYKELKTHFKKPRKVVAQIYGMSESTFKRRLRDIGIKRWENGRGEKKFKSSTSRQKNPTCSDAHMTPLVRPPPEARTMTIKGTYRDDMIKFDLSFSSRMVELNQEVSERLKLNVGTYKIKYLDDVDDQILITGDKDLQYCMSACNSSGMNTIKMFIEPITKISPST